MPEGRERNPTWPSLIPLVPALPLPGGPRDRDLPGQTHWVRAAAVTPDGRRVVSGGYELQVHDLAGGGLEREFRGVRGRVFALAITPDSRRIVAAYDNSLVRVWDIAPAAWS
jgi:WD40 repeat protein